MTSSKIRATLGFFLALAGCAGFDPRTLAAADDRAFGTGTFIWLVDHEPSAVIVWHVPVATVRAVLPASRVLAAASTNVCGQAAREHALLVSLTGRDRAAAEDCGFALQRDAGGIVVAPR